MSEYIVKIGFWLRAYDGFTVEADSDAQAIEKAKAVANTAMESWAQPEHIDIEERREGVIVFIDRVGPGGRHAVTDDVAFATAASTTARSADLPIIANPGSPDFAPGFSVSGGFHG